MSNFADQQTSTGFELDRDTNTVRFRRVIPASMEEVFDAWTKPAAVSTWWDPEGHPLLRCEIDLRPGGNFTFVNQGHSAQPFTGTYREIHRPSRLEFVALGAEGRVTLRPAGSNTEMLVEIACQSTEHLDQFVRLGVAPGTSQTLDNLVTYMTSRVAHAL